MPVAVTQKYQDTTKDLMYSILLKIGGTMADIKQIYRDNGDDLLYAILQIIEAPGGGGGEPAIVPWIQIPAPGDTATIEAGRFIDTIVLQSKNPLVNTSIKIGTTPGGNEIFDGEIPPPGLLSVVVERFCELETIIYFTNDIDVQVKIFKQ